MDMVNNIWRQLWPAHPPLTQEQKNKALFFATADSDLTKIEQLLNNGALADAINPTYGESAIQVGLRQEAFDAVSLLINRDNSVDKINAFFEIARNGNVQLLAELIHKHHIDVNATNADNETALYCAIFGKKEEAITFLLQNGANPNLSSNSHGGSPLHLAMLSCSAKTVALLLEYGAEVDAINANGETALDCGLESKCPKYENIFCLLNAMPIKKLNDLENNPVYKTAILHFKKAFLDIQKDIVNTLAQLYQDNTIEMNQEIDEYATSDIKDYIYQTLLASMTLPIWYQSRLPQDFNYLFFKKLPEKIKELEENNTLQDGISTSTSTMTFSAQASSGLKRNFEQDSNNEQEERPTKKRKTKP